MKIFDKLAIQHYTKLEEWFRISRRDDYEGIKSKAKGRSRKTPKAVNSQSIEERVKQLDIEN